MLPAPCRLANLSESFYHTEHRTVCGGMKSDDCAADATAAGVLCCLEGNMTIVNASKGVLAGRGDLMAVVCSLV